MQWGFVLAPFRTGTPMSTHTWTYRPSCPCCARAVSASRRRPRSRRAGSDSAGRLNALSPAPVSPHSSGRSVATAPLRIVLPRASGRGRDRVVAGQRWHVSTEAVAHAGPRAFPGPDGNAPRASLRSSEGPTSSLDNEQNERRRCSRTGTTASIRSLGGTRSGERSVGPTRETE